VRVTQSTVAQQFIYNLQQNEQSILTVEQQLSTGKRLLQPQDNPAGAALAMKYQAGIDSTNQYLTNDQSAQSWLTASGTALQSAGSILQQVQNLAIEAQSPSAVLSAITPTLSSLSAELMTVANSQMNGQYLFAGTDVTSQPYSAGTTVVTIGGTATTIATYAYGGTTNTAMTTEIQPSVHMQYNVQGDVFTQALNDLAHMVGTLQSDPTAVGADLTNIQNDLSSIQGAQAVTGSWQQRLTQNTQSLQSTQTNVQTQLGNTQDVDVASAIVNLQQEQNAYQAALGVGAMLQQTTLLNYLHP
jgi:flagellar hook-associated protein 3 FlgL